MGGSPPRAAQVIQLYVVCVLLTHTALDARPARGLFYPWSAP